MEVVLGFVFIDGQKYLMLGNNKYQNVKTNQVLDGNNISFLNSIEFGDGCNGNYGDINIGNRSYSLIDFSSFNSSTVVKMTQIAFVALGIVLLISGFFVQSSILLFSLGALSIIAVISSHLFIKG